ncbi:hypothetical protein H257_00016 [Aphanomyces astaci]|uniref:PABS domain-containing protein n=1 Tax=Aphanomyces astaci TaxID=112090 RepID=W4HAR7_APHAT|nr:hypothetical protein H257_00016 [Aphanomyces astaci]ETV88379.1 hypothetical protein H257_00016 [Aphanomyces astaci]|eukprot:XP_009820779.1 hypothetical protein H257_00016 [Aphanomyces astaci]
MGVFASLWTAMAAAAILSAGMHEAKAGTSSTYSVLETVVEGESKLSVVTSEVSFDGGSIALRFLLSDQSIIGGQFEDPEYSDQAIFPGFAIMQASRYLDRPLARAMQIGLGVGTVPTFLREHGVPTDVVEISGGVVKLAEEHFGYENCVVPQPQQKSRDKASPCPNGKTVVMDGLVYLSSNVPPKPSYDLVIVDVYTGYNVVPFYTDATMWQLKESWLKPRGVVVLNFVGYDNSDLVRAIHTTLRSVFQHVRCFREMAQSIEGEPANLVFYASSAPVTFKLPTGSLYEDNPAGYYEVIAHFQQWEITSWTPASVEVAVAQDEFSSELGFDDLKPVADGALILKSSADFDQFRETLQATEVYMREYCIAQFPAALWTQLGLPVS